MHIATISSKNQITLPAKLLAELQVRPKQRVLIEKKKGILTVKPLKRSIVDEVVGSLTKYVDPKKLGKPWNEIMEETKRLAAQELAKKL